MKRSAPKRGGGRTRKATTGTRSASKRRVAVKRSTRKGTTRSSATARRVPTGRGLKERNRGIQRSEPFDREEEELMVGTRRRNSQRGSEKQVTGAKRIRGDRDQRRPGEDVVRDPGNAEPDEPAEGDEDMH